jgi:hypothetical protein
MRELLLREPLAFAPKSGTLLEIAGRQIDLLRSVAYTANCSIHMAFIQTCQRSVIALAVAISPALLEQACGSN